MERQELTDYQINYLLSRFFSKSMRKEYAGWKTVAIKLLKTGNCIVAGEQSIWIDGVAKFIKTKPVEEGVGCLSYTLDLEMLLSSQWFKNSLSGYIEELSAQKYAIEQQYLEITHLQE